MELYLYLDNLTEIFREVRRVLRDDGTLWLNIGDSYTGGGRTWRQSDKKNPARGMDYRAPTPPGLKPKDLIGIPWKITSLFRRTDGTSVPTSFGTSPTASPSPFGIGLRAPMSTSSSSRSRNTTSTGPTRLRNPPLHQTETVGFEIGAPFGTSIPNPSRKPISQHSRRIWCVRRS